MAAKLPSIPAITNDLANHVVALRQIKGILEGAGLSGSNLETALAAYLLSPDPIGSGTPNKGTFSTLTLTTPVATPAAGQVGAGDTAFQVIGAAGKPQFRNSWGNSGSGTQPMVYIKLPTGMIWLEGSIGSGASGTQVCDALPSRYWPAAIGVIPAIGQGVTVAALTISAAGVINAFLTGAATSLQFSGGWWPES